jgi:hypothetical protein
MRITYALPIAALLVVLSAGAPGQIHLTATLSGSQAGTTSTGTGTASMTLNENLSELTYVLTFQGLSGPLSAAGGHFHFGPAGVSGPVVKTIAAGSTPGSQTISGVWRSSDATQPLTPAAVESLLTGRVYINLHTAANPAGEIRGQVALATALHFAASLDGTQAGTSSTGTGTGVFVLDPVRSGMTYRVTYRGLTGPLSPAGGHLHVGRPGISGPVVKTIASGGGPANGTVKGIWTAVDATQPFTLALVDSLVAGKLYVNLHTTASPAGEIRGQLVLQGGYGFQAEIDGSHEVPPNGTGGEGTGSFVLNGARNELAYNITWVNLSGPLSPAGGHIHVAPAGRSGSIVRAIVAGGDSAAKTISGLWRSSDSQPLTPALVESLLTGRLYVNLHTQAFPAGEVRGQIDLTTGVGFAARLDGAQTGTGATGTGTGSIVLNAARTDMSYSLTFFGLTGPLSAAGGHFHFGAPGVSGPVVKTIAAGNSPGAQTVVGGWSSGDATQPLTAAAVDSLIAGRIYANLHTAAFPAGEIRGQLAFGAATVTGIEAADVGEPERFVLVQNYPNPFNPQTVIRFTLREGAETTLRVYDLLGQEVATLVNGRLPAGTHEARFDGTGLASGAYFYRLATASGFLQTKKMILIR